MIEYNYIAKRLRICRKEAGLSTKEAGKKLGRSHKTIESWESGHSQPNASMLIQICRTYGVDISAFYPPEVSSKNLSLIRKGDAAYDDPLTEELLELWIEMDTRGRDAIIALARSLSLSEANQHQVHKTA